MFARNIKMYDEPHSPEKLNFLSQNNILKKGKFLTPSFFYSYYLQMVMIRDLNPSSVLEIGPGESFIAEYMRGLGINYETMDIMEESNPTILSKLEDFDESKFIENYDVVCSFQMLEHSPYENFISNLNKIACMSKQYICISLPYACYGLSFSLNLMFSQNNQKRLDWSVFLPSNMRNRKYREEYMKEFPWAVHYWEIGRKGFPLKKIKNDIESCELKIIRTFHSNNPYHYFFLLEK